ncbi:MAG: ZPR1 zinc finger domain-containing protein, partial [Nitrospiraceae bacterium]|nr:ZPR1 zinc finger domain-containing protein [Nitrospiraceae bacterium]
MVNERSKSNEKNIHQNEDGEIVLEHQKCPICNTDNLVMIEKDIDIPHFGRTSLFSMYCTNCSYHKADIESLEKHPPTEYDFEISTPEDLNVRVVKSSTAEVIFGRVGKIESGVGSNGYITNIEGLINRMESILEDMLNNDEYEDKKKIKAHLKKLRRVKSGFESMTIKIKDENGNSAILSDKAVKKPLK